jgi:hypothetical protein
MLAAAPRAHAEESLEMVLALLERGGSDDEVVERRDNEWH